MPLSQVKSKGLRNIIAQATEKDCTKRYQTAAEFRAALDNFSMGRSSNSFEVNKTVLIGGIAAAVTILVACLVIFVPNGDSDGADQEAEVVEKSKLLITGSKMFQVTPCLFLIFASNFLTQARRRTDCKG